jgi:hypothetical protein
MSLKLLEGFTELASSTSKVHTATMLVLLVIENSKTQREGVKDQSYKFNVCQATKGVDIEITHPRKGKR